MESYLGNHRSYYPQGLPTTSEESSTATTYSASPSSSHYPLYHGINPQHTQLSPATSNHSAAVPMMRKAPHQYSGDLQYSQHNSRQFSTSPGSSQLTRPISDPYLMRHNSLQHAAPYIPPHSRPPDVQGSSPRNSGTRCLEVTRVGPAHTFSSISPIESGQIITSRPNIAHASVTNSHTMDYRLSESRFLDQHRSSTYGVSSSSRNSSSSLGRGHSSKSGSQHPPTLIKAEEPTTLSAAHLQLQRSIQQPHTKEKRFETATAPVPYAVAKRAEDPYYNEKLEESYACIKKVENPYAINNLTASSSRSSLGEVEIKRQKNEAYSGIKNQQLINAYANEYSQINGAKESWITNAGIPQTTSKVDKYRENKSDLVLDLSVKTVRQTADSTAPEPDIMTSTSVTSSLPGLYGNSPYNCYPSSASEEMTETEFHRYSDVNSIAPNFGKLFSQEPNGMPSVSRYSPNISAKRPSDSPLNQVNKMSKLDSTFAQQQYPNSRRDKDRTTALEPYPSSVKAEAGSLRYPGIAEKMVHDPYKSWNSCVDKSRPSFAHSSYIKPENCQTAVDRVPEISPTVTSDSKFYQTDVRGLYQNVNQNVHNASNYLHSSHYYNYADKYPGMQPPYTVSSIKEKQSPHSYYNSYGGFGPENLAKNTSALEYSKEHHKGELSQPFEHHREIRVKTESEINNSCMPPSGYINPGSSSNCAPSFSKYNSSTSTPVSFQYLDASHNNAQPLMPNDQSVPVLQDLAHKHNIPNAMNKNAYLGSTANDYYSNQCNEGPSSVPTINSEVPKGQHALNHSEQCKMDLVPSTHSTLCDVSIEPCVSSNNAMPVNNISNKHKSNFSNDVHKSKIMDEVITVKEIIPDSSESYENLKPFNSTSEQTPFQSPNLSISSNRQPEFYTNSEQKSLNSSKAELEHDVSKLECADCPTDKESKTKLKENDCNITVSKPLADPLSEINESKVRTKDSDEPLEVNPILQTEKSSSIPVSSLESSSSHIASNDLKDCSDKSTLCMIESKELNSTSVSVSDINPNDSKEISVVAEEKSKVPIVEEKSQTPVGLSLNSGNQNNLTNLSNKNISEVLLQNSGYVSESPNQLIDKDSNSKPITDSNVEVNNTFSDITIIDSEEKLLEIKEINGSVLKGKDNDMPNNPVIPKSSYSKEENSETSVNKMFGNEKKDSQISKSKCVIASESPDTGIDCSTSTKSILHQSDSLLEIPSVTKPTDLEVENSESTNENLSDCKLKTICETPPTESRILECEDMTSEIKVVDVVVSSCIDGKVLNKSSEAKNESLVTNYIETAKPNVEKHIIVENVVANIESTHLLSNNANDLDENKVADIKTDVTIGCQEVLPLDKSKMLSNGMEENKPLIQGSMKNEIKVDMASLEKNDNRFLNNEVPINNLKQDESCLGFNRDMTTALHIKKDDKLCSNRIEMPSKEIGEINNINEVTVEKESDKSKDEPSFMKESDSNVSNLACKRDKSVAGETVDIPVKKDNNFLLHESKQGGTLKESVSKNNSSEYINKVGEVLQSENLGVHENKEKGSDQISYGLTAPRDKFESKEDDSNEPLHKSDDIQKYTTNIIKKRLLGPCGTDHETDLDASKSTIGSSIKSNTSNDVNMYSKEVPHASLGTCNSSFKKLEEVSSSYPLDSEIKSKIHSLIDSCNDNEKAKDLSLVQESHQLGFSKSTPSFSKTTHEAESLTLSSKANGSSRKNNNTFVSPWQPVMPYSIPTTDPMSLTHKLNVSSIRGNQIAEGFIQERPQSNQNVLSTDINFKQIHQTKDPVAKSHLPPPHSHLDPYLASRSPFASRPHPAHSVPVLSGPLNPPLSHSAPPHSAPPHSAHSGKTASKQSAAIVTAHNPYYNPSDRHEYRPVSHALQSTVASSMVSTTYNPSLTITTVSPIEHYDSMVSTRSVRSPHSPTHPPPPTSGNSHLYSQRTYSHSYQGAGAVTDPSPYNYMASKPTYTQGNSYGTPSYSSSPMNKTHTTSQPSYHDMQATQSSQSNLSSKHAYQYPDYQNSYSNQLQHPYHSAYKYPFPPSKDNFSYPPISKAESYSQSIPSIKPISQSTPPVSYPNHLPQQQSYSTVGNNSYPINNYSNSLNLTTQSLNVNKSNSLNYPSVSQPSMNPHHIVSSVSHLTTSHLTTSRSQPSSCSPYSTNLSQSYEHPLTQLQRHSEPELPNYPQNKSSVTPSNFSNTKPQLTTQASPSPYSQTYLHMSTPQPPVQSYHSSVPPHSYHYQHSQHQSTLSYASIQSPHASQSSTVSAYPTASRTSTVSPRGSRASTPHSNSQSPRNISPHPSRYPSPSAREYQSGASYPNSTLKDPRSSSNRASNQTAFVAKDQQQPANLSYKAPTVHDSLNPQIYGNPSVVEPNSLTRSSPMQQPPLNLSSNSNQHESNITQHKSVQSSFQIPSQLCLPAKVPISHVPSSASSIPTSKSLQPYANSYFPPKTISESHDLSIPHAHGRGKSEVSKFDNYKMYQQGENVLRQSPYNNQLQQSYKDYPPKHDISPYQSSPATPYTKLPVTSHSDQCQIPPQVTSNNAVSSHYPRYPAPDAHYHYGSNQHLNKISPSSNSYHHQINASLYSTSLINKPVTQSNYQYSSPVSQSSSRYTSPPLTKNTTDSPSPLQGSKTPASNVRYPSPHSVAKTPISVSNYSNTPFIAHSLQQTNKNTTTVHSNYDKPYPNYQSQHPLPSQHNSQKHSTHPSDANQYPILPAHSSVSKASHSIAASSLQSSGSVQYNTPYMHPLSAASKPPVSTQRLPNSANHLYRTPFHANESAAHMQNQTPYSRQSGLTYNKDIGIKHAVSNTIHSSHTGVLLHTPDVAQYPYPKPAHSNSVPSHYSYHDKPCPKKYTELTSPSSLKTHSPSLSSSKDLQKGDDRQLNYAQFKSNMEVEVSDKSLSHMTTETKIEKTSLKPAEPGKAALVEKLQKKLIKKDSYDSETYNDEGIDSEDKHNRDIDLKFFKLIEDLETNKDTITSKRSCIVTKRYIQKVQLQNAADNNEELIPIPYTEDEETESEREEPIKKFRGKFRSIKEKAVERVILTYASHSDESATEMIPDDDASDFEEELIKEIEAKARKGRSKFKGGRLREVTKKYSSDERSTKSKRKMEDDTKTRRLTRKREKDFCLSSSEDLSSSSDSRESSSSDDSNSGSSLDSASASEDEPRLRKKKSKISRRQRTDDSDSETSNSDQNASSRRKTRKRHKSSSEEANYIPKRSKLKRRGKHHLKKDKTSSNYLPKGAKRRRNEDDREPSKRRILMRKQGDLESDSDEPMKEVTKNFKIIKRRRQVTSSESEDEFEKTENSSKDYQIKDDFESDNDSEVKFVLGSKKISEEKVESDFEEKEMSEELKICVDSKISGQRETEEACVPDTVIFKLTKERQGELNREDVIEMKLWQQKASLEMEKLLNDLPETRTRHMWKKPNFVEEFKKGWQEEVKKYKVDAARIPKKLISTPPLPSAVVEGIEKGTIQKKTKDSKKSSKFKGAGSPSPAKNTRSKSGIIKTSMAVADKNYLKVASRPGMSSFMQSFFEKVMADTVTNESKKFQAFAPFTHTRIRTPTGLTPTPSVALSMMASDDSDRDSLASLRTDIPASDSVPVARRSSIANSLIKKLKKKYAKKVDTQWLNKSRPLLETTNEPQLLPTPGLSNLCNQLSTTPYDSFKMKTFFREYSFNRYRENFDQVLSDGGINKLTPVLVPSRTRNKAKAILDAATLKSVFGEELCSLNSVKDDSKPKKKTSPQLFKKKKETIVTTVRDSPIPSSLSMSSTPTEYLYNEDYDSELRSERSESTLRELAIMQDIKKSGRKLRKYRKFRSGFDYIRKKKKVKTEEESSVQTIKKKMPTRKKVLWPEDSRDVANEVRSWVVNKGLGETVLHKAARLEYHDVVIYCLESGDFNINTKDNAGYTPLHEACYRGHLDIAQAFCAHGAHVNASGYGGMRPLHEAIENGHIELARLLLSYGADPSLATYGGQSCLALASDSQAEKFLQDYTADVKGKQTEKWFISGPASLFDPVNQGINIFSNLPKDKIQESANWEVMAEDITLDPSNNNNGQNRFDSCFIKREKVDAKLLCSSDEIVFQSSTRLLPNIYDISGRPDSYILLCELLDALDLTKNELIMSAGGIETLHLSFEEFEKSAKCHFIGYNMSLTRDLADSIVMVKYTSQVKDLFDIEYTCV